MACRAQFAAVLGCLACIQARNLLVSSTDPYATMLMDEEGAEYLIRANTFYESLVQLEVTQADSIDACAQACSAAGCSTWSWCPTSEEEGCSATYNLESDGTTEADKSFTFPAGACNLMAARSSNRSAFHQIQGVAFVSGVRNTDWLLANGILCRDPPPDSLAGPPNTLATAVQAKGTQNFTCVGGKWELVGAHTNLYFTEPTAAGNKTLVGYLYTAKGEDGEPLPTFVFTSPDNTTVMGEAVTARKETYDVEPANPGKDAVWYRRPVLDGWGRGSAVAWVVRTDTKGGAAPGPSCTDDGAGEQVPMTAYYTFYVCAPPPEEVEG